MAEEQKKKFVSKGTCNFCKKPYSKAGMSRHLAACKARQAAYKKESESEKAKKAKKGKLFHIQVTGFYIPIYWMHIEIPAGATLRRLDGFLRDIWLECCGHLSMFRVGQQVYSVSPMSDFGDRSMGVALDKVFKLGMEFTHEYDFGTTTHLTLKVVAEREGVVGKKSDVQIMVRNHPPEILCESCGKKPATLVCGACIYYDEAWYCDDCAPKHECGEEMMLPVVNSPRVGMCGYTG